MNKNINKPTNVSYIRVRYGETDRMGILHHSIYPLYFEEARTDLLRKSGKSYKELEDSGIILPVRDITITYYHPAYYDDVLAVKVTLEEISGVRLNFSYEITNEENIRVATATTSLIFTDAKTFRPVRPSAELIRLMTEIPDSPA